MPFIGVVHNFMDNALTRDEDLGLVRGYLQSKYAKKAIAPQVNSPFSTTLRTIFKVLIWKVKGLNTPSAFFDNNGEPIANPRVLTPKGE
ncbi:hypothetical protein GCM10008107_17320 [Psychrosphaera saromensis]|uniref:Uncharacterized protein n=2 Tax=Psychrosphaera saromensis TaxID=716813 RepID=A0A2S7USZ4_9GAMM|nr:hypothetical protein BTO11_04915 [Psychrosphaera saromensis]GHB68382.1 hypothetical protein GCM10008107_17320 [Psychrosphaera saromensis]GLQ15188.1 hypothetical protein GCM10007917_26430 [Psychrosphaera saromensis]